ncbi:hypothetical protein DLAC_00436 [Tieghemostelium lacteum]|uniref:Ankyrin repeat-containing protein n=1 Tax=Tieghemostelium lacteum TaxID=361077 RepID=A0A152A9Q4_TIELA|nr:hypothetical protein DLAC_00436 [Tieghemostelium lacteum]|eukprot:KYR02953.1 hypothetical protein DLAC_00436 [Tieghemostelium lacteum]
MDHEYLIRSVFFNKILFNEIFRWVRIINQEKGLQSYSYCDINSIDWLINNGHQTLLMDKINRGEGLQLNFTTRSFNLIAEKVKDFEKFKSLYQLCPIGFHTQDIFEWCCKGGSLPIIQFLLEKNWKKHYNKPSFSDYAIRNLVQECKNIDLKTIQWLNILLSHQEQSTGMSKEIQDLLILSDIDSILLSKLVKPSLKTTLCSKIAKCDLILTKACEIGNLDIVEFMFNNGNSKLQCLSRLVETCIKGNHFELVKYFFEKQTKLLSICMDKSGIIDIACSVGNLDMIIYLVEKLSDQVTDHLSAFSMYNAAGYDHLDVCKWLYEFNEHSIPPDKKVVWVPFTMGRSSQHASLNVLKFLCDKNFEITRDSVMDALESGSLSKFSFLYELYGQQNLDPDQVVLFHLTVNTQIASILHSGNFEILIYLNGFESFNRFLSRVLKGQTKLTEETYASHTPVQLKTKSFRIFRWCIENFYERDNTLSLNIQMDSKVIRDINAQDFYWFYKFIKENLPHINDIKSRYYHQLLVEISGFIGDTEIFEFLALHEPELFKMPFSALTNAVKCGNLQVIQYFINEKSLKDQPPKKMMIELSNCQAFSIDQLLEHSVRSKRYQVTHYLFEQFRDLAFSTFSILNTAFHNDHLSIAVLYVEMVKSSGLENEEKECKNSIENLMNNCITSGQFSIATLLFESFKTYFYPKLSELVASAIRAHYKSLYKYFIYQKKASSPSNNNNNINSVLSPKTNNISSNNPKKFSLKNIFK